MSQEDYEQDGTRNTALLAVGTVLGFMFLGFGLFGSARALNDADLPQVDPIRVEMESGVGQRSECEFRPTVDIGLDGDNVKFSEADVLDPDCFVED